MFQPGDIITANDMSGRRPIYLARVLAVDGPLVRYCVLRNYIGGSVQPGAWMWDDARLCRLALGNMLLEDDDAVARG